MCILEHYYCAIFNLISLFLSSATTATVDQINKSLSRRSKWLNTQNYCTFSMKTTTTTTVIISFSLVVPSTRRVPLYFSLFLPPPTSLPRRTIEWGKMKLFRPSLIEGTQPILEPRLTELIFGLSTLNKVWRTPRQNNLNQQSYTRKM